MREREIEHTHGLGRGDGDPFLRSARYADRWKIQNTGKLRKLLASGPDTLRNLEGG